MKPPYMEAARWAIAGVHGLYTGQWLTRSEAIDAHVQALGRSWTYCRKKGDRAVKVQIRWAALRQGAREGAG